MRISIPLLSDVIPAGTGLVQFVECRGIKYETPTQYTDLLASPVAAQVTTFANGIRRVCCPKGFHNKFSNDDGSLKCDGLSGAPCIYAWNDNRKTES